MNKIEQGVLQKSKLICSLVHLLILFIFVTSQIVYASSFEDVTQPKNKKIHLAITYASNSQFYSNIAKALSEILSDRLPQLQISEQIVDSSHSDTIDTSIETSDVVIAIGDDGIHIANKHYPVTDRLLLSTGPDKNSLKPASVTDATLYLIQPYCRQIQFIKLINERWKVISLLYSKEKPVDIKTIQQCAKDNDLETYILEISDTSQLTDNVKNALTHSDLLLALPDKNIYNSKTVKNILLTSYRLRKPVIAFSHNFVNAGALASIHSTSEQIAQDASDLIELYFNNDRHFTRTVSYPASFDISINRQVLRALDISPPDESELKHILEQAEPDKTGKVK
jgi:ABC-type uncharacterized transport system substrate-binding protein